MAFATDRTSVYADDGTTLVGYTRKTSHAPWSTWVSAYDVWDEYVDAFHSADAARLRLRQRMAEDGD